MRVSAGIIRRADGKILLCQRGAGRNNAHLWEFPGGKQEAGETAESCLERELIEQLRLKVWNSKTVYTGQKQEITFDFVSCETTFDPILTEHENMAWVSAREMLTYPLCPADRDMAFLLAVQQEKPVHFIWDFDGTLMDTYPMLIRAIIQTVGDMGVALDYDEVNGMMKHSLRYCAEKIAREHKLNMQEILDGYREVEKNMDPGEALPLPGIPQTLEKILQHGGKNYLATHRDDSWRDMLRAANLDSFISGAVTVAEGFKRKPDPGMLFALMERQGINPRQAIMIGDRPLDIGAGKNAGILTCMLDVEHRFPDSDADLYVDSAQGLWQMLLGLKG